MNGMHETAADLAADFDRYFERVPGDFWPGGVHAEAMRLRWDAGSGGAAIGDPAYLEATYAALRGSWRAFRNSRTPVTFAHFRTELERMGPHLGPFESMSIADVDVDPGGGPLLSLFEMAARVKETGGTRWMAASKILYHLLPDLVVPMDSTFTAPFFGRRTLPTGLDGAFLHEVYGAFSQIARGLTERRIRPLAQQERFSVPLGMARVIDFGIIGWVKAQSAIPDTGGASS